MTIKKMGLGLIGTGLLVIFASILVDLLPGGKPGIQSAQILGIELALLTLLLGLWATLSAADGKIDLAGQARRGLKWFLQLPVIVWVLIGFFIAYLLFSVSPMFLDPSLRMTYFNRYLPDMSPIGNDLLIVIELMKGWFLEDRSPYELQFYPPFTYMFFAPLLLVDDYTALYRLFTLFSLVSYCFLTLILPAKMVDNRNLPLVLLFFVTGLSSYGLQFELERGQYNVFTFLLCLWAIYIFHYYPRYRIFAYLLFSISVQLKIYPAIFIVMFIDNWRAWKDILLRFAGIALFNILLLFIMGFRIFLDFLAMLSTQLSTPGWTWNGNHSINAFVFNFAKDGFRLVSPATLEVLQQNAGLLENLLLLIYIIAFVSALLIAYRRDTGSPDPYLLLTCMIGALIIPISNDYTLSILAAPVALLLSNVPGMRNIPQRLLAISLVLGISFAYASVLVPFKYKPYYLNNAFTALFLILLCATVLNLLRYKTAEVPIDGNESRA